MTAADTANLRVTFTAPSNGTVLVRAKCQTTGMTATQPQILLGVLDGSTVKVRMAPTAQPSNLTLNASNATGQEAIGLVTGLTAGNSYTWDLAYGVEVVGGTNAVIKYGGPNDASGADAWGSISLEIWSTTNLLAGIMYDPSTAASLSTSLAAMTAMDTTNLRNTFTAPASGNVFWRIRTLITGSASAPLPSVLLGIKESSTVVARQAPEIFAMATSTTLPFWVLEASGVISGVSAGSHSYDASYAVQLVGGSTNFKIKYGGPNNTTANDAWGGILFDIWTA